MANQEADTKDKKKYLDYTGLQRVVSNLIGRRDKTDDYTDEDNTAGEIFNDYSNNKATGKYSHAEGIQTTASGEGSHAEGGLYSQKQAKYIQGGKASGQASHAEGIMTVALSQGSHAEGSQTKASGYYSHAEGSNVIASGASSHAEGVNTIAEGNVSHTEGGDTNAIGVASHAEGTNTNAIGVASHAEGTNTNAIGVASHAENNGIQNIYLLGPVGATEYQISGGMFQDSYPFEYLKYHIIKGNYIKYYPNAGKGKDKYTIISTREADGKFYITLDKTMDAINPINDTTCNKSCYFGTFGSQSHAEGAGCQTLPNGIGSHAEGTNTVADKEGSHAEGTFTLALAMASHAEGNGSRADGIGSHAEGGIYESNTHMELRGGHSEGDASHAEGIQTISKGKASHTEGIGTITNNEAEHASGKYNISKSDTLFSIGNGTSDTDRKNAFEIKNNGDVYIPGSLHGMVDSAKISYALESFMSGPIEYEDYEPYGATIADATRIMAVVDNDEFMGAHAPDTPVMFPISRDYFSLAGHKHSWGDITSGKPTTLGGYGITDALPLSGGGLNGNLYPNVNAVLNNVNGYNLGGAENQWRNVYTHWICSGSGDDTLILGASNTDQIWLKSNGNVGIGTSSPTETLDVNGNLKVDKNTKLKGKVAIGTTYANGSHSFSSGSGNETKLVLTYVSYTTTPATANYNLVVSGNQTGDIPKESILRIDGDFYHVSDSNFDGTNTILEFSNAGLSKAPTNISRISGVAFGIATHSEGNKTLALSEAAHSEGYETKALGNSTHAEGWRTIAKGNMAHSEGCGSFANGESSHAEGYWTRANQIGSHAEGTKTLASERHSHTEGLGTKALGIGSHAEGFNAEYIYISNMTTPSNLITLTSGKKDSDLYNNRVTRYNEIRPGDTLLDSKLNPIAGITEILWDATSSNLQLELDKPIQSHGDRSRYYITLSGSSYKASEKGSHAEGIQTTASGEGSHAEGNHTIASNYYSHAEGGDTLASGSYSHAEGGFTHAAGGYSHAEGSQTKASGYYSHAEGLGTITNNEAEHASGKYNISNSDTLFSIGIGKNANYRKNAFEVKKSGNVGIGSTGSQRLHVEGNIQGNWYYFSGNTGIYSADYGIGIYAPKAGWMSTYQNCGFMIEQGDLEVHGNVLATGEITASDVVATSDRRLKSDIKDLKDRGPLKPRTFIKNGKKDIGFIAQEVRELYPELVVGEETEDSYLALNYAQLTAVLAVQINNLKDENKSLKLENEKLSNKIKNMNEKLSIIMKKLDL